MKRYKKEIIKLTASEVLLRIFDLATPFLEADRIYRVPIRKYRDHRRYERSCFGERIRYLKKRGLIESFVENKEKYVEITAEGLNKIKKYNLDRIKIERQESWDGKWRVAIFDIPDKRKKSRDTFRFKLLNLRFQKIQESVYVYPFECSNEIQLLSESLAIEEDVLVMISEIIQGEDNIIERFLNSKILTWEDIKLK